MNKILIFTFLTVFSLCSAFAQISKKELQNFSQVFIEQNLTNKHFSGDITELKFNNGDVYAYVVAIKPKGFIVFSPSKKLTSIIAFSTESNFDFSISKDNLLFNIIKADMKQDLQTLKEKLTESNNEIELKDNSSWKRLTNTYTSKSLNSSISNKTSAVIQYGAALTSIWGGVNCYDDLGSAINVGNYYTPNNYSPGCVATALSMILHYYKWPETGVGSHINYDTSGSSQTSWTANFGNATYDWSNMLDEYYGTSSNLTEQKAMGYISFHTATALDMDYESTGSTSNINKIPSAAGSYFRFSGHHQYTSWTNFWSRMHENLENGHPVPIAIEASTGEGHAPVIDGYRYNEGDSVSEYYYHLNMGWYGTSNAWYRMRGSFSAGGYTSITSAVFDLLPEPVFTKDLIVATSKTFILNWKTSDHIDWDAFELQESSDEGATYSTLSNTISDTTYTRTVASGGTYKYRVRSKVDGNYYADSYSEPIDVQVPYDYVYLDFDGNDSFFINDNANNDLDISNIYTIETWINIDSRTSGTYPVILDRRTVFSMFLIDDSSADYAVKFVSRDSSGNAIASVQSDNSIVHLNYGDWVHVAVSRSGSTTKLFINGTVVMSSTDTDFSLSGSTYALNIGARYWSDYERYLDGKIDKIRITNSTIYTSNFTPDLKEKYAIDSSTRMLLALDEGAGDILTDGAANFSTVQLRSSPNQPNWIFGDENLSAKSSISLIDTVSANEKGIENKTLYKMNLYPNPASSIITTLLNVDANQKGSFLIFDFLGQKTVDKEVYLKKGENRVETNISNLQTGFYLIEIKTSDKKYTAKFFRN